jgi:hypothetical protein
METAILVLKEIASCFWQFIAAALLCTIAMVVLGWFLDNKDKT